MKYTASTSAQHNPDENNIRTELLTISQIVSFRAMGRSVPSKVSEADLDQGRRWMGRR